MNDLHYIQLVPVSGGYALHTEGCRCEERKATGPETAPPYLVTSLADAAAAHVRQTGAALGHVARRSCTQHVPASDSDPQVPWAEVLDLCKRQAAASIWMRAETALKRSRDGIEKLATRSRSNPIVPVASITEIAVIVGNANYYARCVEGFTGLTRKTETAERLLAQTEASIQAATYMVMGPEGSDTEVEAARYFLRSTRKALAPLQAHRAMSDFIEKEKNPA